MEKTLRGLADGTLKTRAQNHADVTMAPILNKVDGLVRWTMSAAEVFNRQRAFTPWPGIHTTFRKQSCQLIGVPTEEKRPDLALGELVWNKQNLYVVCGRGSLFRVEYVKVEGRKQVTAQEFGNGARIAPGERFGEV
jgi:methionyl-tRNA formyltransferase